MRDSFKAQSIPPLVLSQSDRLTLATTNNSRPYYLPFKLLIHLISKFFKRESSRKSILSGIHCKGSLAKTKSICKEEYIYTYTLSLEQDKDNYVQQKIYRPSIMKLYVTASCRLIHRLLPGHFMCLPIRGCLLVSMADIWLHETVQRTNRGMWLI